MVGGTMSIYTYDDNWNFIHIMCIDKQNNECSRKLVIYRKIMCAHRCLRYILISVIVMSVYPI